MKIIKTPEPFSPAFGEILYAVSLTEQEKGQEISIFNSAVTEKIGIKKATDAPTFNLNVADYVRSQIRIEPLPPQAVCGIVETPERIFQSCIAWQDWASVNKHTAGSLPVKPNHPMRDNDTVYYLGESEQDEISWIAPEGEVFVRALFPVNENENVEIHLGRKTIAEPTLLTLLLPSEDLGILLLQRQKKWRDFSQFFVEIHAGYELKARFEYRIRPHNCRKTRLAWWNRYGGVDFYSFESTSGKTMNAEKKNTGSANPDREPAAQIRMEKTVATACTTQKHSEWLAGILASPQAWVEENGAFIPIRILSEKITAGNPDDTAVEIRFAYTHPIAFQSL